MHPMTSRGCGLTAALCALLGPALAAAQDFTLHAEPAAAFWLDKPQSDRFTPGVYFAVRPGISIGRVVSLQASYSLLYTPARGTFTESGTAHSMSGGLRLRPFAPMQPETEQLGGLFADFNAGYVWTGPLDRFGFDAGLGYGFQVSPGFSLGPVVRYGQVVQPDGLQGRSPHDAQFLTVGLDFGFGKAWRADEEEVREVEKECPEAPECAAPADCPECVASDVRPVDAPIGCPDGDRDGVCDADDRCPTQIGPPATLGCPIDPCSGAPLVVLVQFPYDSAALPVPVAGNTQTMDPVLDAVAAAIAQDPSCQVCIIGNASEEGGVAYNTELSQRRADAVKSYMTARGLGSRRMPTVGLGAACQLVPESSRPLNRRVEFRRLLDGDVCPTNCLN